MKLLSQMTNKVPIFEVSNIDPGDSIKLYLYAENAKGTSEPAIIDDSSQNPQKHYVEGETGRNILSSFVVLDILMWSSIAQESGEVYYLFDSINCVRLAGLHYTLLLPRRCDGFQGSQGQLHLRQSAAFHQPSRHHGQRWRILCLLHPRTLHHLHIQEKGWCRYNGTLGQLSHKILLREKIPSLIEFYQMETSLMWIINILLSDRKSLLADCQS